MVSLLALTLAHAAAPSVEKLVGDIDGDGIADQFIANPWGMRSGDAAHVRIESGRDRRVLWAADWIPGFGMDVVRLGDLDGDGRAEFAIGSPSESHFGREGAGAIYVFSLGSTAVRSVLAGERAHDSFGASLVAIDLDDDGRVDLLGGRAGFGAQRTPLFEVLDGGRTVVPGRADISLAALRQ